ncbi:MAG: hypothetical protein JF612_07365, partial [Planctomycetia bacterium]|nr:hypothetical protein [Planctomycetia bacterium]
MKLHRAIVASLIAMAFFATAARAEKDADLKLLISKASKSLLQEKFDGPKLPKGWAVAKGDFQVKDGTIVGWETKEDVHPAVLMLQKP